jgi:hypothetical protein
VRPARTTRQHPCPTPTDQHRGHEQGEDKLIPKVHRRGQITGLGDLLSYLFGPGLDNERGGRHVNPRVIAAWAYATAGNLADLQPPRSPNGRPAVRRLTELLEQPARICGSLPALPVWHCSIHNHPDDPILTDQHWEHITTEIAAAVGLAPHGDLEAVRWIAVRHGEGHVHLVATLARQDRRAVWLWQDYRRAQARCRELEHHYDLHRVGGRRTRERYPKPAELNKTTRQQRDEVPRHRLRNLVHTAADSASGEHDFLHRLRTSGLLVRPRTNTTDPIQLAGYAVALHDDHNAAGDTIWYSGSALATGLSLPNLRRRWRSP